MSHRTVGCQEEARAPQSAQGLGSLCEDGMGLLEDRIRVPVSSKTI